MELEAVKLRKRNLMSEVVKAMSLETNKKERIKEIVNTKQCTLLDTVKQSSQA